jgi:cell wall assembly regulator SMI1
MSTELRDDIDAIFNWLAENGHPAAARRRAGIAEDAVAPALQAADLDCPPDLAALYGVCDGVESSEGDLLDDIQVFPGHFWMPLQEALEMHAELEADPDWPRSWLPVFATGAGDFYAVICDSRSRDFGGVVGFLRGEDDPLVEFRSLKTMMTTIRRSFEGGAFVINDGYLESDYPKMQAVAAGVQPGFVEHKA